MDVLLIKMGDRETSWGKIPISGVRFIDIRNRVMFVHLTIRSKTLESHSENSVLKTCRDRSGRHSGHYCTSNRIASQKSHTLKTGGASPVYL